MTSEEFQVRLANAQPGEAIIYFIGYLPAARQAKLPDVEGAGVAWAAYGAGKVELVQRKLGEFEYEYRAVVCR